jgi:hypothetical protein
VRTISVLRTLVFVILICGCSGPSVEPAPPEPTDNCFGLAEPPCHPVLGAALEELESTLSAETPSAARIEGTPCEEIEELLRSRTLEQRCWRVEVQTEEGRTLSVFMVRDQFSEPFYRASIESFGGPPQAP